VDDLKISRVEPKTVDDLISKLEREFGSEVPLTVQGGKVRDYLGMCLDFSSLVGDLVVSMETSIKYMIEGMPEDTIGTSMSPHISSMSQQQNQSILTPEIHLGSPMPRQDNLQTLTLR
jgi:hypothetical protein